jgi:hypothetical protein
LRIADQTWHFVAAGYWGEAKPGAQQWVDLVADKLTHIPRLRVLGVPETEDHFLLIFPEA